MEGIKGQLEKGFGTEGTRGGKTFGSNLVKTAMGVIASAQIGKTLWSTLNAGAELEQNLGGVQAVYGEFASSITDTAQKAYSQMGLAASDYMATANKMGSLFQGSGLTQQRAMELTTQAMQRAADVASVMGINLDMAMESIAGAAKGNFTMMDNLGVAMNAATLEAYALEKGINFKWNTASQAKKAELAMEMFFDRTSQYAGNFEREANETFSGAFESMKASAKNVLANLSLGEDIKPSLKTLVSTTKTFLIGNFLPAVKNVVAAVPDVIKELGGAVADAILEVFGTDLETVLGELEGIFAPLKEALSGLFSTVSQTVKPLVNAFLEYTSSGQAMADVTATIKTIMEGLVSALTKVVNWITQFINWLNSGSAGAEAFKAAVVGIAAAFAAWKIITTVVTVVTTVAKVVTTAVTAFKALGGVLGAAKVAIAALGGPVTLAIAAITGLVAAVVYLWNTSEGFRNAIMGIGEAISSAWTNAVTNVQNAINNWKAGIADFMVDAQMMRDGLAQYWENIKISAGNMVATLVGYFTNTVPNAVQTTVASNQQMQTEMATVFNNVIANAISWVVTFTQKAIEAGQGFVSNLVSAMASLPRRMYEIGSNIVSGIWNGISAGWNWLTDAVANLANSLFEAAKGALGINSPSRVFRDGVGRWIPAGIAAGIRDYSGLVHSAIDDLTADTTSEFTSALRVSTPRSGRGKAQAATGGKVVNFVQNVYSRAQSAAELAQETRYQAEMKVLLGV